MRQPPKVLIIRTYANYEHIRSGRECGARFLLSGRSLRPLPRLTWFVRLREVRVLFRLANRSAQLLACDAWFDLQFGADAFEGGGFHVIVSCGRSSVR